MTPGVEPHIAVQRPSSQEGTPSAPRSSHTSPHPPQFSIVPVAVSQPASSSQSANPSTHVGTHIPSTLRTMAFATGGQERSIVSAAASVDPSASPAEASVASVASAPASGSSPQPVPVQSIPSGHTQVVPGPSIAGSGQLKSVQPTSMTIENESRRGTRHPSKNFIRQQHRPSERIGACAELKKRKR